MVYAHHDHFWVPPTVIRSMPPLLDKEGLTLEAVYIASSRGTIVEGWPGVSTDDGPMGFGNVGLGFPAS